MHTHCNSSSLHLAHARCYDASDFRVSLVLVSNGYFRLERITMRFAMFLLLALPAFGQKTPPLIPFDSDPNFLKLNYQMNLGEVLAAAAHSKEAIVGRNHPPSSTSGPLYGNAPTPP